MTTTTFNTAEAVECTACGEPITGEALLVRQRDDEAGLAYYAASHPAAACAYAVSADWEAPAGSAQPIAWEAVDIEYNPSGENKEYVFEDGQAGLGATVTPIQGEWVWQVYEMDNARVLDEGTADTSKAARAAAEQRLTDWL